MAEEARGLSYLSTNPSGIGAVYFGNDFLNQHNKNLEAADKLSDDSVNKFAKVLEIQQEKKKQDAKLAEGITKDLAVSYGSAMPEDIENRFKPQYQNLIQQYAELQKKGLSPSEMMKTPEYQKIKGDINQLKGDVQQSATWQKSLVDDVKLHAQHSDKFEPISETLADFRTKPFDEKQKMFSERGGTFLTPVKPKFFEELGKRRKEGIYKPSEEVETILDPVSGGYVRETKTYYKPEDLDRNAQAIFFGEPKMTQAATNDYKILMDKNPDLANQIAIDAQRVGKDPVELFIKKQLESSQNIQEKTSGITFSPEQRESAKYRYGSKAEEGYVNYIIEQGGNLLTGNKDVYTIGQPTIADQAGLSPVSGVITGKPTYADKLQGFSSGSFTKTYSNGATEQQPNYVLSFKWENGKPLIKTSETISKLQLAKESGVQPYYSEGVKIDDEGYKAATASDIEKIVAANSKDPAKAIEKYRTSLIKQSAYPEKIAKPEMTVKTEVEVPKIEIKPATTNTKMDFSSMSLSDKQALLKKSGTKTKEEFATWLRNNNYTY